MGDVTFNPVIVTCACAVAPKSVVNVVNAVNAQASSAYRPAFAAEAIMVQKVPPRRTSAPTCKSRCPS
jgi:hypothetical protein